jgi:flagellar biosynthesis protein FliP
MNKLLLLTLVLFPLPALARSTGEGTGLPNPIVMLVVLGALTLAPFVVIMLSSFVKISVVLSILRNALGTQSVPPNQVITGLAFILSLFVMTPVARQMYEEAGPITDTRDMFSEASVKSLFAAADKGKEPLREFLARHAHDQDRLLFMELANRLETSSGKKAENEAGASRPSDSNANTPARRESPDNQGDPQNSQTNQSASPAMAPQGESQEANTSGVKRPRLDKNDFQVLIPAFVTSQLKEAFQIGFLVFIPFIIIDMVIANLLLAMGMSMLSPSVISLPFKLLLFVLIDGWFLIVRGLVLSYA